jgi:non-specific serine/threonine protein kinase
MTAATKESHNRDLRDLTLTPAGHLLLREADAREADGWTRGVAKAFGSDPCAGLFALAARRPKIPPPPSLAFWREFAAGYLTQLCRTPEVASKKTSSVEPPLQELAALVVDAPPMQGGEYLSADVLASLWTDLDAWVRQQLRGTSLTEWLRQHAPGWHQVGRVCFHLAENKRDADFPFAFLATYAPRLSRAGKVQYRPLSRALQEYAGARNKPGLVRLLSPVQEASAHSDLVRRLVDSGEIFQPLAWTPAEAYELLTDVPTLEECGLLVRLPDWWHTRPRPRVSVSVGNAKPSRFGVDTMLDFDVGLALGDERLTKAEWKRLMAGGDGLVQLKGRWVEVDRERLAEALAHWQRVETEAARGGLSFAEGMRLLAGAPRDLGSETTAAPDFERQWSEVVAGKWLAKILADLREPARLAGSRRAPGLRGTLRPYQEEGHDWLRLVTGLGLGACLADDMGLGKTIQVLALLLTLKQEGRYGERLSLLVLPASLLGNWKAEIERFAPTLRALTVHPAEQTRQQLEALAKAPKKKLKETDLVLTTYGMLSRQKWLTDMDWGLVVIDEAQAIKNPGARQTKAVKQLRGAVRIALTGTPVENRLLDLWSIFDFLCPGLLGSQGRFRQFVKSLEARERERWAPLRNLVTPYILRRMKTDRTIITDLPEKTEMKTFCGLTKPQVTLYARSVVELERALDSDVEGIQRRGLVLSYLMRFKQICNHPSQWLGDGDFVPAHSGKFERLRALAEEIASRQEKMLVFTQFREMTEPVAAFLADVFGADGLVLHGGTSVGRRKALVDAFQRDGGPPFFVLSLKAGGVGLNLTAAAHVVHFDRWWNPAVEDQATDRAFRIGQTRNVLVHKFICRGTVEEKIDTLIDDKRALAGGILEGGGEAALTEMDDETLLATVALDIDRAGL